MDLFNLFQRAEDDSFHMRMAAVNQMSQMMHSLMMNPLGNIGGLDPLGHGLMGIDPQSMLGPAVGVPALRHSVPANPWLDLFSPGAGSSYQSMSLLGGDASVHSYCSSTMMSMSTGPDGRPMVYKATSSTKTGPGGVCETQKSVCDGVTGTKKMQIGRHIGNRGHVIEKEQNFISGEREEREDFINIEEDEAEKFTEEFEWRARVNRPNSYPAPRQNAITSGHAGDGVAPMLALPSSRPYATGGRSTPTSGWVDNTYGSNWYPNQSSAEVSSLRHRSKPRKDHGVSAGDPHHSRNRNRPRKVLVRSTGDPHPYSCEKMRKRDHSQDEAGGPSFYKTPKTYPSNYENVE